MKVIVHQKPHKCPKCDVRFNSKRNIARHIQLKHSNGGKKYHCYLCKGLYQNKGNYNVHFKKHLAEHLLYMDAEIVDVVGMWCVHVCLVPFIYFHEILLTSSRCVNGNCKIGEKYTENANLDVWKPSETRTKRNLIPCLPESVQQKPFHSFQSSNWTRKSPSDGNNVFYFINQISIFIHNDSIQNSMLLWLFCFLLVKMVWKRSAAATIEFFLKKS